VRVATELLRSNHPARSRTGAGPSLRQVGSGAVDRRGRCIVPRPFLTARWCDVLLLTFEAPDDLIRRLVPAGVEPDRWNGRAHVSLVALGMRPVRVRGWPGPGLSAQLQVNFPPYVRYRGAPGVRGL